jgi:hypothetical protein
VAIEHSRQKRRSLASHREQNRSYCNNDVIAYVTTQTRNHKQFAKRHQGLLPRQMIDNFMNIPVFALEESRLLIDAQNIEFR